MYTLHNQQTLNFYIMLGIFLCLVILYFISGFLSVLYYLYLCYEERHPFEKNMVLRVFLSGFVGLLAVIVTEMVYQEESRNRNNQRKK